MTREDALLVIELRGRLGNQLFQFATGLALARRANAQLRFTDFRSKDADRSLERLLGDGYREASKGELLRVGEFRYRVPLEPVWRNVVSTAARAARRARGLPGPRAGVLHPSAQFRPALFELVPPAYVIGYHQSERYFADVADDVVDAIRWPASTGELPGAATPTVAVSFRRGDYNDLGAVLPWRYYAQAMDHLRSTVGPLTVVLFGDDPLFVELVARRFELYGQVLVALDVASDPVAQLRMMSECDHAVIANSSFAWWGAWLGDHRPDRARRVVICPYEYALHDRIPERWTKVRSGVVTNV